MNDRTDRTARTARTTLTGRGPLRRLAAPLTVAAIGVGVLAGAVPAGAARTPNACKALTTAQITAAYPGTVSAPVKSANPSVVTCRWTIAGATGSAWVKVLVQFVGAKEAVASLTQTQMMNPIAGASGYYTGPGGTVATLKGKWLVSVQGGPDAVVTADGTVIKPGDQTATLLGLTKQAVANL